MSRYLLGRIAQAALVLWGAYSITYFILYLLPGDPLSIMLSASGMEIDALSPEQLAKAKADGVETRALVVINPGNPTGASLPRSS